MQDFGEAILLSLQLVLSFDADLLEIIGLSMRVSLTAVLVSCLIGLPLGALVAVGRFPGRWIALLVMNALMGLPPVVVGLIVYLNLSRAGPFGWLGLLYTPSAMIIAQTILITPIIAALSRQVLEDLHDEYAEQFRSLAVPPATAMQALIGDGQRCCLINSSVTEV
jgi:tungstate transport system permease protein